MEHTSDLAYASFSYLYVIPCLSGSHRLPATPVATAVFTGKGKEFCLFLSLQHNIGHTFAHVTVVSFFSDFKTIAICVVNNDNRERI